MKRCMKRILFIFVAALGLLWQSGCSSNAGVAVDHNNHHHGVAVGGHANHTGVGVSGDVR